MNAVRLIAPVLVCVATASPVFGDVTIKSKGSATGMVGAMAGDMTQHFKQSKLRTDQTSGAGRQLTTIIDANLRQMIVLDHEKKQAEVIDMSSIGESLAKIGVADIETSVTPTGQTRQVAGSTCAVYDVKVAVPMQMANQSMTMVMSGPQCVVKNGPGHADIMAFYRTASEKGFFLDAAQAKAQPAAAKAMAEMQKKMADLGVPFAAETKIGIEGSGMMADLMKKMGNTITTEVTTLSTAPIPDSIFEIPADYKVKKR
jgi:Domain of unknown function (DUF4412)